MSDRIFEDEAEDDVVDSYDGDAEDVERKPDNGVPVGHPDAFEELPGDWKVPPRWLDASDMPTKVMDADGNISTEVGLHEGESVWLSPTLTMGTMFTSAGLALYGAEGGREGQRRMVKYADDLWERLAHAVAHHTLTDMEGRRFPSTRDEDGGVVLDALVNLSDDEVAWLLAKITGQEDKADRGEGSRRLRSTSGAKVRRRRRQPSQR